MSNQQDPKQQFQAQWTSMWKSLVVIFGILSLIASTMAGIMFFEEPEVDTGLTTLAPNVNCYMEQGGSKWVASSGCEWEIQTGATFDLFGGYPVAYASAGQELACGTATFTGTTVVATGLSTATYAIVTMITDPSVGAGAPFLVTADAPTTSTLSLSSWQDDANAATSGVTAHWCAVGTQ